MRSASVIASLKSWVTNNIDLGFSCHKFNKAPLALFALAWSSETNGSSINNKLLGKQKALASETRRCIPSDK